MYLTPVLLLILLPVFSPAAYLTENTEDQLKSLNAITELRDLVVPEGLYKTSRSARKTAKKSGEPRDNTSERGQDKPGGPSTQEERISTTLPSSHSYTRPDQQPYHQHPDDTTQGIVSYSQPSLDTDVNMAYTSSSGLNSGISPVSPLYSPTSIASASTPWFTHLASYHQTDTEMAYAQASSGYSNYASYSSQAYQSQLSQHPQIELHPSDGTQHAPSYEELAREGRKNVGSGYGSSGIYPSPMSEYSTLFWHHQFPHPPELSHSNIHEPFPHHPSSSQSHLHLQVDVHPHPQSHTPDAYLNLVNS